MSERHATSSELRYAVLALQREGTRRLAAALVPHAVSPSQAEVILVLGEHGPLTLKGLGSLLVCEAGSPSRLVDSLVRRGLVDRTEDPFDRRRVLLRLTADGERLRPELAAVEAALDGALDEAFDDDLRERLLDGVRRALVGSGAGRALDRRFGRD